MASTRKSIVALYAVQLITYALPLITIPYLSYVLGPAGIGTIGYAQTVAQILLIFVDFGFDLTSTRKIAIHRNEPGIINRIYWTTMSAKTVLALIGSGILIFLALAVYKNPEDQISLLLANLVLWGNVLTPTWLYQGLQRMSVLAASVVVTRIVLLAPLFLLVKGSGDVGLAAGLQFAPSLISGLVLTAIAFFQSEIRLEVETSAESILAEAKESYHLFLSSALTSIYMYANVLLLRLISGSVGVGYYVAADKITTPLRQLSTPPIQAFFPKICGMYAEGDHIGVQKIIRRFILAFLASGILIFVGFELFGAWFIQNFFGSKFHETFQILRVMIIVPVIIGVAATLVQLRLIASGNQAVLKKIYSLGAIFHVCQAPFVIYYWGAVGAAYSVVATEVLMTAMIIHASKEVSEKYRFA
ncbi:oligosaccharide flippase family protein [Caballeronia mineralivorans]|jgi:PST family polysaccharide transporter|uniref:oligosaccharide flippase family protein n=1 Tax=Caballeronia mineralivorans TaxID=2010198 RepID=UPI0023F2409B|nr:oligosaccharide flippase family protein [Caballeronia mineralivorans]MDB5788164.1 polysaccharide biosynthesis protein [Caballeronia mineralivorans]